MRENESWLASEKRDHITAAEVARRFVLMSSEETGMPEPYAECLGCHDLLYTAPRAPVTCSCGALTVAYPKPIRIRARKGVRGVRLIGKAV